MNIRKANKLDAERCGRILYDAFNTLAEKHNFPRDFPSPEVATGLLSMLIGDSGFYGVVAEEAGTIVGSNFMDERSNIFGIGPISVAPEVQNHSVGRRLMDAVLDRATAKKAAGIRLVQAGYHNRSLCLYTKLGFVTREPLSLLQGPKPLMPSLPVTMSGRLKSAMLKGATSCAGTFTALTGIASYAMRFARARQVWSNTWERSRDMRRRLASWPTPSPAQIKI